MSHLDADGYVLSVAGRNGTRRVLEHVAVAEAVLGKPLPIGAVVHHHDENRANNHPTNLVICPSRAYHNLLHRRIRALAEAGNADWMKCVRCLKYDEPKNLSVSGGRAYHRACNAAHVRRFK